MNFTKYEIRIGAGALLSAALVISAHCANFFKAAASAPAAIVAAPAEYPAGSAGRFLQLGKVKDKRAQVTINGGASATVNGVTISSLAVNGAGAIRALVSASCRARDARFTLQATADGGWVGSAPLTVEVTPNPPPTLGYDSLHTVAPGGKLTIKPARGLSDQGEVARVAVHRVTPKFRGRLSVDEQGVVTISRAPARGNYNVTIRATDNCGADTYADFTLKVGGGGDGECPVIGVNPSKLRDGAVGAHYFQKITADGAALPYRFSLASGELSPGLKLFPPGIIAGAPAKAGDYEFSLRVTDKHGCIGTGVYALRIKPTGSGAPISRRRGEAESSETEAGDARESAGKPGKTPKDETGTGEPKEAKTKKDETEAGEVKETKTKKDEAGTGEPKEAKTKKDETGTGEPKEVKTKKGETEAGEVKETKTKKDEAETNEAKKLKGRKKTNGKQ